MDDLARHLDRRARETGFEGAVSFSIGGGRVDRDHGIADRSSGTPVALDTRFAIASGTKTFTALAVLQLVEAGALSLETTARSVLGPDLPLIDDRVTVEHLLAHRSGIGDYFDEDATGPEEFTLPVAPASLDHQEAWVTVLDGHPTVATPGETFAYNNGGYVLLALLAERVSGVPYAELVERRVCARAGMTRTTFHRADSTDPDLARGYLDDGRDNAPLMPMIGGGDGGLSTTLADMDAFWTALTGGRIVEPGTLRAMTRPRRRDPEASCDYGLGCWLRAEPEIWELEGCDAGISFRSMYRPGTGAHATVMANTTDGAWPIAEILLSELRAG